MSRNNSGRLPELRPSASTPSLRRNSSLSTPSLRPTSASSQQVRRSSALSRVKSRGSLPTILPSLASPKEREKEKIGRSPSSLKDAPTPKSLQSSLINIELCSICLEPLDDGSFVFPCGQQHTFHYRCALTFVGCTLAMPLPNKGGPGPLQPKVAELGDTFRAIDAIERALDVATQATLQRLCCPLCRTPLVPSHEDAICRQGVISQLRSGSVRRHVFAASRMRDVLARVCDRFSNGDGPQRSRLIMGFLRLKQNLHNGATFFACNRHRREQFVVFLRFLQCQDVLQLSRVSVSCADTCRIDKKLRVPYLKLTKDKVRGAARQISAQELVSIAITAGDPSYTAAVGSITDLDTMALAQWLHVNNELIELSLNGLLWEKVDPGGWQLAGCALGKRLRVLDLQNNFLTDRTIQRLVETLLSHQPAGMLEIVILELNCITQVGFVALLGIGHNVSEWHLRHNRLGDRSCRELKRARLQPSSTWDLRTNGITSRGCEDLVSVFEEMSVARLGCNPLGDVGLIHLITGMSDNLKILDLKQAQVGDSSIKELGRSLSNSPALEELLLSGNEFGAEGAGALANGWAWLRKLHYVDLSHNAIGSYGVELIANQLPLWHQNGFRLNLINAGCEDDGVMKLTSVLREHPRHDRQWEIELQSNPIRRMSHVYELRCLLERNPFEPDET